MKKFSGDAFLINNAVGQKLYDDYAKAMPIFDYHNHLSAQEICEDARFDTITELWLAHDHYKWRAMRAAGIDEFYITGDAPARDKFLKFAAVTEKLIGCPLYYWVHFELAFYFDIHEPLSEKNAAEIYERCNAALRAPDFSARGLIERSNVRTLCTTDDPTSDLRWHRAFAQQQASFRMLPSFRADRALQIESDGFSSFIKELSDSERTEIRDFSTLLAALESALRRFKEIGCVVSDHGLERCMFAPYDEAAAARIFDARRAGAAVSDGDAAIWQTCLLVRLARLYKKYGIVMQLHLGAARNNNTRLFDKLGPDCGADSVGDSLSVKAVGRLLDTMNDADVLPKTILYPINPSDFTPIAAMAVNFNCGKAPNYVALGNAWWFNDTVRGIRRQLTDLMETGGLPGFVGMLTDSRSLTSFTRHDFFRRILCDLLGDYVEKGEYPCDYETLGALVRDVCYNNAERFFDETIR
ncbi:MAG: glucuronate isomerase [Oscillospiraceae bacterium]|nr:glucuronate isomerase [Oscillospiraceae bacterium]